MTLEAHVTTTRRVNVKADVETLIAAESITAANFQGVAIRANPSGDEMTVLIIADTGA